MVATRLTFCDATRLTLCSVVLMPTSSRPPDEPAADLWYGGDLSPELFQALGYRVIDTIAEYLREIRDVPVFPARRPEDVARVFEEPLPEHGQDPERILDEWTEKVLPDATHLGSPRYFGFVNGSGSTMGILAEALAASVNMNAGGWKPAPSATEVERRTLAWMAELIGYDPACGGLLTSGGTMANFTALHTALRNTAPYDTTPQGLQDAARTGRFLVYASDHEGHVSLVRAVDLMNLGREALRRVPSHDDFTMDVAALRRMIAEDRAPRRLPVLRRRPGRLRERGCHRPSRRDRRRVCRARTVVPRRRRVWSRRCHAP